MATKYSVKDFETQASLTITTPQEMVAFFEKAAREDFIRDYKAGKILEVQGKASFADYVKMFDTISRPQLSAFAKHYDALKSEDSNGVLISSLAFHGEMESETGDKFRALCHPGTPQHNWAKRKGYEIMAGFQRYDLKGEKFFQFSMVMIPSA